MTKKVKVVRIPSSNRSITKDATCCRGTEYTNVTHLLIFLTTSMVADFARASVMNNNLNEAETKGGLVGHSRGEAIVLDEACGNPITLTLEASAILWLRI